MAGDIIRSVKYYIKRLWARDACENLVTEFLIEVRENSRDNSAARRLLARFNASKEIMLTAALKEAKGAAAGDYSSGSIIGEAITLILRDIFNSNLGYFLLYNFRI